MSGTDPGCGLLDRHDWTDQSPRHPDHGGNGQKCNQKHSSPHPPPGHAEPLDHGANVPLKPLNPAGAFTLGRVNGGQRGIELGSID